MCPSGSVRTLGAPDTTFYPNMRQAFEALDADRDGKISSDDLGKFYTRFSRGGADEDAISTMMSVADLNKDGFVEYDEFERVLGNGANTPFGVMHDVFKVMDKDGDGRVSHYDLKSYMRGAGFSVTDEDVKSMIRLGGGDKIEIEGITFDDFLTILDF